MTDLASIADRVARVRERIERACAAAGRRSEEITLVAVAKTHPPEAVAAAAAAGVRVIGENRVQEAAAKLPLCPAHLEWHLVGHLQSNKVRPALRLFSMLHSVDSIPLLRRVDQIAAEEGRRIRVLLEVNVAGERSKFGFPPDAVAEAVREANRLPRIELAGLMTVPPICRDPEDVRPFFRALRELRDRCTQQCGTPLPELSMGMSADFEVAIAEGATMIRVGTDIFGPRASPWRRPADEAVAAD
ncbi:MAG: YggS family pyridoxal phosphate-dependent enzyme [Kiritimatiellae bacterium]|nr:YggS family pyridoxal phosphate-dependent enzyme [Kiritimatiellia bacterium]